MGRIVVGIDDTEASRKALQWAANEARMHKSTLEIIYVYQSHDAGEYCYEMELSPKETEFAGDAVEQAAIDATERARDLALQAGLDLDDDASTRVVAVREHRPADALIRHSSNAEMLVLGCRSHGIHSLVSIGSVSRECALHSHCPVTIIHA